MKHRAAALLLAALLLTMTACASINEQVAGLLAGGETGTTDPTEQEATQFEADVTFQNSFLGLSFTVPGGWWQYYRNAENFNESPGTTADPLALDMYIEAGYRYMGLGKFATLQYSNKDNHLGMAFYAEYDDTCHSLDDYIVSYVDYMLTTEEGYEPCTLVETDTADIAGTTFAVMDFEIPQEGGDFRLLTLCCRLENGYYLVIETDFWPANTQAKQTVLAALDRGLSLKSPA